MDFDATFLPRLTQILGTESVLTGPDDLKAYGKDWTTAYEPDPCAVALPKTIEEVAAILQLCSELNVPVVPSGGRTGLAAGAVARGRELVLSLSRLNRIEAVDLVSNTVRVQAGAVTQAVHEKAAAHGLTWPVDLASKGSCEIGGNLSTNAGGLRVIRYGHARNWVQSLQVVMMSGEVLELNGNLEKNNTGYDLRHLLIGSEGTLAVVTGATLKLTPLPGNGAVAFFSLKDMKSVLELLRDTRASAAQAGFAIQAFECFTQACLDSVCAARKHASPLGTAAAWYVLIEFEVAGSTDGLDAWLGALFEKGIVVDGTLATAPSAGRALWEFREGITESLALRGTVYKNDLALPISKLDAFTADLFAHCDAWYGGAELYVFGHVGDGNLHINVLKPKEESKEEFLKKCEFANHKLFAVVKKYGGSIAAEHGIGLLKKSFLLYSRAPTEVALMRAIKQAFDPKGLLNPGKIFD